MNARGLGSPLMTRTGALFARGRRILLRRRSWIHVEKGMQNGQKITFPGEADEAVRVL